MATVLPADHFLSEVVEKALFVIQQGAMFDWKENYVHLNLLDPFQKHLATTRVPPRPPESEHSETVQFGQSVATINHSLDDWENDSVPSESLSSRISVQDNASVQESFGVLLCQIFRLLSVLSQDPEYLRLPAISTLHRFASLGQGKSFIARKIPREQLVGLPKSRYPNNHVFVYKSLRHFNRGPNDIADDGANRLKNILLEMLVLTHPPLRSHDNILRLIGFGWETNRIDTESHVFQWPFVVLEYAEYGNMVDVFEQHIVGFDTRRNLCIDVGQGLSALHRCEVIHGDVKLENILVFPHKERGLIAKIADFGFTLTDLEGKAPRMQLAGFHIPWNAPEFRRHLNWNELYFTDVYSYGFLIWRTMCYGHAPFTENGGLLPESEMSKMILLKEEDKVLDAATRSLDHLRPYGVLFTQTKAALGSSLQLDPAERNLESCLHALGAQVSSSSKEPLRHPIIPPEQGLGIYEYNDDNLRLSCQLRHALESYCLSAAHHFPSSRLIGHASATLYAEYLSRYFSGDTSDFCHKEKTMTLAMSWLAVSAGTGETSSAEALFPVGSAFSCPELIPEQEALRVGGALGLAHGSEFILKDVLMHPVPRKDEFLGAFRTKYCRGVGLVLGIPKDAFDGSGVKHYTQWLGEPFSGMGGKRGTITPEYLLRFAAAWGCLDAIKSIVSNHKANVNAQDLYGETALLKACRAGHPDVVRWLLDPGGAKANISTMKGITPLHWLNSFTDNDVGDIAKLLKEAGADPNAIAMDNDEDAVENQFYFFKGPPLMRVVAPGNIHAVRALLDIGADPTIAHLENPITFAARRLRVDVLKILLEKSPGYLVWDPDTGSNLVRHVMMCPPSYGAKIHGKDYLNAHLDMFDFVWSKAESPARLFRSITRQGFIPIQVAVREGNMALTKKIVESCPSEGHLKELLVTIGLQSAIVRGRWAIFTYLLEQGAQPLHPFLTPDPNKIQQFDDYVLFGPWTMDLVPHQRRTTSLHLCAKAGELSAFFGLMLLKSLLPASRWDRTPETLREENHTRCCGVYGPVDDPIVDCRNEYDQTPFFCALREEEYGLAHQLFQAGANKNALVKHPAMYPLDQPAGPVHVTPDINGLPIVEHALTWVSAYRAIHFLIRNCWGCLRLTNTYGDELRVAAIEETARWPLEEASTVFKYVMDRAYPNFKWDAQLTLAVECLNEAAVSIILRKQNAISRHRTPEALYDALRQRLFKTFAPAPLHLSNPSAVLEHRKKRLDICKQASGILSVIRDNYSTYPVGGSVMPECPVHIIVAVYQELTIAKNRYLRSVNGARKFLNEVEKILEPWLVVMGARAAPQLIEVQEYLREVMGKDTGVEWHLDTNGNGLCKERTKILQDLQAKNTLKGRSLDKALQVTRFDKEMGCWDFP